MQSPGGRLKELSPTEEVTGTYVVKALIEGNEGFRGGGGTI